MIRRHVRIDPCCSFRFGFHAPPIIFAGTPPLMTGGGTLIPRGPELPRPLGLLCTHRPASAGFTWERILYAFNQYLLKLAIGQRPSHPMPKMTFCGRLRGMEDLSIQCRNDMGTLSLPEETSRASSGLGLRSKAQTNREMPATRIGNTALSWSGNPCESQSTFIE